MVARALLVAIAMWDAEALPLGLDEGKLRPRIEWRAMELGVLGRAEGVNTVVLNSRRQFHWNVLCAVVGHEVGHLAGRGHNRNPRSIMYPRYRPDPRCRDRGIPYLTVRGYNGRLEAQRRAF